MRRRDRREVQRLALVRDPPAHLPRAGTGPGDRKRLDRGAGHARLDALEDGRDALAAADAQRGEPVPAVPLSELRDEGEREPRARGAERVAERDGAAVHVRLLAVEAEILLDGQALRGKGLVDLDEVHVRDG